MRLWISGIAGVVAIGAGALLAQEFSGKELQGVQAKDIKWMKAEGLPAGCMVAHVWGEAKGGSAVDFIKFPAGTTVPLHWHSPNHVVTVVSGKLTIGGKPGEGTEVGPGGYFIIPGRTPHWTQAKEDTVFVVSGDAPNDMNWAEKKPAPEPK